MADETKPEKMRTVDGREIDSEMIQYIWRSALEMVESFEAHFDETYYDERTSEEKLQQTYRFENQSRPARAEKLSYAIIRYTIPEDNSQIFASKYFTYLPTEEELKRELRLDEFVTFE